MKSNDNIPADEMLLAEAIAAARARGLKHAVGQRFIPSSMHPETAEACCVLGALQLAGCIDDLAPIDLMDAWRGNDDIYESGWPNYAADNGASLGWAFRCAMTEDS